MRTPKPFFLVVAGLLLSCGQRPLPPDAGAGSPGDAGAATDAGTPVACDSSKDYPSLGTVCAIRPSRIAPGTKDDFGWHVVAVPAAVTASTKVSVHLVGTGGKPFNPTTTGISSTELLREAVQRGRVMLMPAYDNAQAVGVLCAGDAACFEPVRWEIITGTDAPGPYAGLKPVAPPDDLDSRLAALVHHVLAAHVLGDAPPAALASGTLDWAQVRVSGHSQGGGHAGVIAKHRQVERACLLAAPIDGTTAGGPAAWTAPAGWVTPPAQVRAVVHQDDPGATTALANYAALGLARDAGYALLVQAVADPHSEPLNGTSPATVAARAWACFE